MFLKSLKFRLALLIVLFIAGITLSRGLTYHFRSYSGISYSGITAAVSTQGMASFPTTRDKWLWPFSQDSIWNLPIGSEAQYHPANLPKAARSSVDVDLLFIIPPNSPLRPLYNPGNWKKRCNGTTTYENLLLQIPDDLIVPDAIDLVIKYYTPNNAAALLQPDGKTLIQLEPMARCVKGGPVYGYHWPKQDLDLYSQGIAGGHLGSGLSSIGGTIRKGELIGSDPIRHVLKIEFWEKYLNYDPATSTLGYRWPADRADRAAPSIYKGKDPQLVMGSLLAIPPKVTEDSLGITTPVGKKLFHALQDYGAYHVDVTGRDNYALAVEQGVEEEFKAAYGYDFSDNPFYQDFMKLCQALNIITNNGPNSIGGGGKRRAPLAPPFADEDKTKSSNSNSTSPSPPLSVSRK